jgi:hypothetical protein
MGMMRILFMMRICLVLQMRQYQKYAKKKKGYFLRWTKILRISDQFGVEAAVHDRFSRMQASSFGRCCLPPSMAPYLLTTSSRGSLLG